MVYLFFSSDWIDIKDCSFELDLSFLVGYFFCEDIFFYENIIFCEDMFFEGFLIYFIFFI